VTRIILRIHKNQIETMTKSQFATLILALLFFSLGTGYDYYSNRQTSLSRYTKQIETHLHEQESRVEKIMEDRDFIYRIIGADSESISKREADLKRLRKLAAEEFTIYITVEDSIIFWNNNLTTLPPKAFEYDSGERGNEFIQHSNGYYQLTSQTSIDEHLGQYNIHAMIPIRYNYQLVSNYIKDEFVTNNSIPNTVQLADDYTDFAVYNKAGEWLFYLDAPDDLINILDQKILLLLYLFGFIILGCFIHITTLKIVKARRPLLGAFFMVGSVGILRLFIKLSGMTDQFSTMPFFTKIFDSAWTHSLSDMLLDVSLLLWLMIFFHQAYPMRRSKILNTSVRFIWMMGSYFTIVLSFLCLTAVFKMIVFNSSLNYDFNNVFNLDKISLVAIIAVVVLLAALFIFSHRMILIIKQLNMPLDKRITALAIANLAALPIFFWSNFLIHWGLLFFTSFMLIIFFDMFVERRSVSFQWFIFLLGILAAFPSVLLFMYNSFLDTTIRFDYARELSELRDPNAEHSFKQLITFVQNDPSIKKSIRLPSDFSVDSKEVSDLLDLYLTSDNYLFYNYTYKISGFNNEKSYTFKRQPESYPSYQKKLNRSKSTGTSNIHFLENQEEDYWSYLLDIPVKVSNRDAQEVNLVVEFIRSRREQSKVYTELLVDQPYKKLQRLAKYDFAVYRNKRQLDSKGNIYGPILTLDILPEPGNFLEQKIGNRTEVIYQTPDAKTVVIVGREKETIIKSVSLFSYMLTLMIGILVIALLLNSLFKFVPNRFSLFPLKNPSLKNKIQLAVVALTISSFVFIGITTTWFFKNSSEEYHEKRLERKASSVLTDAQREIERMSTDNALKPDDIKAILKPVSETHRIDINLYGLNGHLIGSSEEDLYNKGVISRQMGAVAYQALARHGRSHYTQDGEHIGSLTYKAAYVSLVGPNDEPVAYMGLPYYSKQSKMSNDVTLFMSTLINVYVFLLFIAGGIAIFTANSITKHITKIGEKLKQTKLGQSNTPLEWESDDEIGALIKQYNKMIRQLDTSAQRLAQSEREGAWREMAKQVAHEIKNPLTPMKLSIQYLQHAFQSQPDNIEPLLKRVAATLIEQIDNLSQIAVEFSNFAKMPQAENQQIVLNAHVESVYNLFRSEDVDLQLKMSKEEIVVFADKNHLVRVFNNLIKNAIQAIPEERYGKILVSLYQLDDVVIVCVHDNGTGISDDKKDKVFVPNFTTKNSGTGLGLAISKNIIESVNGRIWFETELGVGTKFFVELPIVEIKERELEYAD